MKLLGRVAIVTGGSGNLGRAIVEELAKEGADVVFTYFTNKNAAKLLELQCKPYGRKVIGIKCDVRKYEDVKNVIDFTVKEFGKIDILVNNAAKEYHGSILEITEKMWMDSMEINLYGPFYFIKLSLPYMINQNFGKIINIISTAGIVGGGSSAAYSSSKGGLWILTKQVALEVAKFNINVNAIAPGFILRESSTKEEIEFVKNMTPLGKVCRPQDIVKSVIFLASNESQMITGKVLIIDGGSINV